MQGRKPLPVASEELVPTRHFSPYRAHDPHEAFPAKSVQIQLLQSV